MANRLLPLVACLAVLPLAACNRPPGPAPAGSAIPVAATEPPAPGPTCAVESRRHVNLGGGTELRIWNLKAAGLKRLAARLTVATDGKALPPTEVDYTWEAWPPDAKAVTGQLVLLMEDGKPFGAPGRRLPQLALDLDGSPSYSKTEIRTQVFVDKDVTPRVTDTSFATPLNRRSTLYVQLFVPTGKDSGAFELSSDPDSIVAASKGGRTVVAVTLEWAPQ